MRILIIGAKGMLGQELADVFASAGHDVIGVDRDEFDITNPPLNLPPAKQGGEKEGGFDLVINAAAYNNVDQAEKEPEVANAINGVAVGYLAAVCREQGMPIVQYSTDYVFDGKRRTPYTEDDVPNPQSAYARSKLLGEERLMSSGATFWLIRTSRLFGRSASAPGAKKSFPDVLLELAQTKKEFSLVDEEVSSPTYARDLATRTLEIVRDQKPFGVYHVTNSGGCTWFEYGKIVFALAGLDVACLPVPSSAYPRPASRPAYSVLTSKKIPPLRTWQEALKEYLNSMSSPTF